MAKYVLGIDLGTTSIKACIIDIKTKDTKDQFYQETYCNVPPVKVAEAHEQDVCKIVTALNTCLSKISQDLLKEVVKIGICCQMHGVVLWKTEGNNFAWNTISKASGVEYEVIEERVTHLYTWEDGRCDTEFLNNLPKPESHLGISTGFGIPTIFWISHYSTEVVTTFNCSGTIGSFIIAMICSLQKPSISYQNAASWGYFNCLKKQWNLDILKTGNFPIQLLPDVRPSEDYAGRLADNWCGIPKGTPVSVDLGDLQCTVLSTIETQQDATINITTSAQVAYIVDNFIPSEGPPDINPPSYWPYFQNQYVAVAASLNGGNILDGFVNMLYNWIRNLGLDIEQSKIWGILLNFSSSNVESNLKIKPTCLGERFNTNVKASVSNITLSNIRLDQVYKSLCTGLIENLYRMLPSSVLKEANIIRLIGNGSALLKNEILQKEIERIYEIPLEFTKIGDAAKGAALAVLINSTELCSCKKRILYSRNY